MANSTDPDRRDLTPAQKVFRRGEPRSWLLRPGETENEHTREYDALKNSPEGTPKLEEIAWQLNDECVEYSDENGATLNIQKAVDILRPFITPACSPEKEK